MEPNQNVNPNPTPMPTPAPAPEPMASAPVAPEPVVPATEPAPAAPAGMTVEEQMVAAMQETVQPAQPMDTNAGMGLPAEPKKSNKLAIVLLIILLVAAVGGGAAFAVMTIMNKDKEIASLNERIEGLKKTNKELQDEIDKMTVYEDEEDTEYISIEGLGIKIKQSDTLPNMTVVYDGGDSFVIKETADATALPNVVTFVKSATCDDNQTTTGYGAKITINGTCYLMSEILPYGSDPAYPMTAFLEYVVNAENYSAIEE